MKTDELLALLPEYVLGTLSPAEMEAVQAFVEGDVAAMVLVSEYEAALSELAFEAPARAPRLAARTRLLNAAEARPRLEGLTDTVSRFLDVGAHAARRILNLLDDAAAWITSPLPGLSLCDVDGGPAVAGARVGLVRLAPGVTFPHHLHYGDERALVLQGGYVDDTGRVHVAGQFHDAPADSEHHFTALAGPDLVYLVVLYVGISIPGFE